VLRRLAPAACVLLVVAGCGAKKTESSHTQREKPRNQPAVTVHPVVVGKGASGVIHVKTNLGSFAFRLAPKASPNATRSFAQLTKKGFFDGLTIHRVVPGFVIQGGDPNGDGTGGPSYTTHDRVAPSTTYPLGTVAMAKTGRAPAGTGGSQFFVVTAAQGIQLCLHPSLPCSPTNPPAYAVIGHITSGMDVVLKIGRQPTDPQTEAPLRRIVTRRVTLTKP
jgi:peptidyl-prolyl cis-trans isomerase B (cyclophilin B)